MELGKLEVAESGLHVELTPCSGDGGRVDRKEGCGDAVEALFTRNPAQIRQTLLVLLRLRGQKTWNRKLL